MGDSIDNNYDPAELGLARAPCGGLRLGGFLSSSWWRPDPLTVETIRELTVVNPQTAPPMPRMPAGDTSDPAVTEALAAMAATVWRAVRHRRDAPSGRRVSPIKSWSPRATREVVGAVNVWKARSPTTSLWAVAAVRWDGLEDWSGSRPRKPVAVLGRAQGQDLVRAAKYQASCQALVLPKTPSELRLTGLRSAILAGLRKVRPVTASAAAAMIDPYRDAIASLRDAAMAEQQARATDLAAAVTKGDWIWTCRQPR